MNSADLQLIAMVIDEPGMQLIESEIKQRLNGLDHVNRMNGHTFDDGRRVGEVEGIDWVLRFVYEMRKAIKNIKEE